MGGTKYSVLFWINNPGLDRTKVESAIPNLGNVASALGNEKWSAGKKWKEATDEIIKPLSYIALPFGGGQIKKILQGLEAVVRGGSYNVDADGSPLLQYPVCNDSPAQAVGNFVQATLFGKTSLKTGRDWIEGGFGSLTAKQTAVDSATPRLRMRSTRSAAGCGSPVRRICDSRTSRRRFCGSSSPEAAVQKIIRTM